MGNFLDIGESSISEGILAYFLWYVKPILPDYLTINGVSFTLENSIATLSTYIASNPSGNVALSGNYDASGDGSYAHPPIDTNFSGYFEGLGNTISDLTVYDTLAQETTGLFHELDSPGTIADIHITTGSSISGFDGAIEGGLVGINNGNLLNDSSDATVTSRSALTGYVSYIGGLAGENTGAISNSFVTGAVTGAGTDMDGGLVGLNSGSIDSSYANGNVSCPSFPAYIGGLAGTNSSGTISGSYATGNVSSSNTSGSPRAGGLVGYNLSSTITGSYATGDVTDGYSGAVGGLVGFTDEMYGNSTIDLSYTTGGTVTGGQYSSIGGIVGSSTDGGTISKSFSNDNTSDSQTNASIGGVIGTNGGTIKDTYSTGSETGGNDSNIGGLIGYNYSSGPVKYSYASGAPSGGSRSDVGGFVGFDDGATYTDGYWDTTTSGLSNAAGNTSISGVTGLTTTQLQSALPTGFSGSIWTQSSGINSGFPYLIDNPPP